MKPNLKSLLVASAASLAIAAPTWADDHDSDEVETFVITASPLDDSAAEAASAVTRVDRDDILESGATTLGETLANAPGIHQSSFTSGASRPIVRGLDNFRVRVQENGIGAHDASALSEDHGVSIDPLSALHVDVVRGPAVLRYGSEAIGGVVNVVNNRIPDTAPEGGFSTEGFLMYSTVDEGWQSGALADFGSDNFAGHVDVFFRDSQDYDTPQAPGTVPGTWVEQSGGSLGGSVLFDGGHIGAAISAFESEYGIPATDEAKFIDMEQVRLQVGGTFDVGSALISEVSFSGAYTDYTHDEIEAEDGDVKSTFNNEEMEGRVEVFHEAVGPFTGAVGVQARYRELSAGGEGGELIAPSETQALGAFIFEEMPVGEQATLQVAARVEHLEMEGTGFRPIGPMGMEFAASRDFTPVSGSAGVVFDLGRDMYLSGTVQVVQRAPDVLELFAKGPHESTETFEIGDPDLDIETARSIEVGLERLDGPVRFELAAFYTSFEDFIFKDFTGIACGEEFDTCGVEDELDQIAYAQEDATFYGFEASGEVDLYTNRVGGTFTLDVMADAVRAELDDGGNVPRIPPFRVGAGLAYEQDRLSARAGFMHVAEQDDLGAFETSTDAYTRVDASLTYRVNLPNIEMPLEVGLVGTNLFDEDARNHTSFKKDDVLLPGRNVRLFVRAQF